MDQCYNSILYLKKLWGVYLKPTVSHYAIDAALSGDGMLDACTYTAIISVLDE
jgi:hypothetical protein